MTATETDSHTLTASSLLFLLHTFVVVSHSSPLTALPVVDYQSLSVLLRELSERAKREKKTSCRMRERILKRMRMERERERKRR